MGLMEPLGLHFAIVFLCNFREGSRWLFTQAGGRGSVCLIPPLPPRKRGGGTFAALGCGEPGVWCGAPPDYGAMERADNEEMRLMGVMRLIRWVVYRG